MAEPARLQQAADPGWQRGGDRIAHALGLVVGTEAMIALTDAVDLDVPAAKQALLDASRWMLAGALAD